MEMENLENSDFVGLPGLGRALQQKTHRGTKQGPGVAQPRKALGNITNRGHGSINSNISKNSVETTRVKCENSCISRQISGFERNKAKQKLADPSQATIGQKDWVNDSWNEPTEKLYGKGWDDIQLEKNLQAQEESLQRVSAFVGIGWRSKPIRDIRPHSQRHTTQKYKKQSAIEDLCIHDDFSSGENETPEELMQSLKLDFIDFPEVADDF